MSLSSGDRLRPDTRAWLRSQLDGKRVVAAAQQATGLDDGIGADLRESLEVLCRALLEEAGLNDAGLVGAHRLLLRSISNRLHVERDLAALPATRTVPIVRPLFIVGCPRTGTTFLHELLAQDPAVRAPALWELECPSPPPDPASRETDPRIARLDEYLSRLSAEVPELLRLHPMASRAPDECGWLLLLSLRTGRLLNDYRIPSYGRYLTHERMVASFGVHRTLLQVLTLREDEPQLVLKDPFHLAHLGALLATYPDAGLIQTHRDPVAIIPSATRLRALVRSLATDEVVLPDLAAEWVDGLGRAFDAAAAVRSRHPHAFHDIAYADLVRDPIEEARRVYKRFDLPWSTDVEGRMTRWLDATGHARRVPNRYDDLTTLGLEQEALRSRFAVYRERFLAKKA